jgi:hypothetical protein
MNTKTVGLGFCLAVLITACSDSSNSEQIVDKLDTEAAELAGVFVGRLLPTLQQAMLEGGPVNGIDVCAVQAPLIAQQLSEQSGWQVKRVSLRARNSATAVPDDWERVALQEFDQRQQSGEVAAGMSKAETVAGEFRFIQAQPAGPLCLTCHGTDLSADVRTALAQYYPDDAATGYLAGQIRGGISMRVRP